MSTFKRGRSTEDLARALAIKAESIRCTLCRQGSYFGLVPDKLPNGRLLWPEDAVERLIEAGRRRRTAA
jgi:hypothetical protein